jgi:uncharacterized protein with NRDE domain
MCLIFIALKQHPDYKLIVAANRDEFYNRKTAPAHFWQDHPDVLGGKDLEAGGTWLGMNKNGRLGMITNYRDPKNIDPKAPSRGHLVSRFLIENTDVPTYMQGIVQNGKRYNGFNLVVGSINDMYYYSNYGDGITKMENGLFGLSNHLMETPWPKIIHGKQRMKKALGERTVTKENFFEVLYNEDTAADEMLPDTGIGLDRERALSAMFIKSPGYGTRCSTVILVDNQNKVSFSERVFDLATFTYTEQNFSFKI